MLALKESSQQNLTRMSAAVEHPQSYKYVKDSVYRKNVLALLSIFGKKALTCHLFIDIDMTAVENSRHILHKQGHHVTVTSYLLKAISIAQEKHPLSRTQYLPGARLVTYDDVVAGFTVEREVAGKPAVFFGEIEKSNSKSILEIAGILKDYAEADIMSVAKLKEQKIFAELPDFLRNLVLGLGVAFPFWRLKCMKATFGLSSLGALGITIACGPSVCTSVFGVGQVEERPVVLEDKLTIKPMLSLALSYDQRAMDGAEAAKFASEVKRILESGLLS